MYLQVGCDSVHIECDATDVAYVLTGYKYDTDTAADGERVYLDSARDCLRVKCPEHAAAALGSEEYHDAEAYGGLPAHRCG